MHLNTGKYILLVGVSSLIGAGCAMPLDEHDPDPAGTLADDGEWWDEGPPDGSADPADAGDDDDLAVTSEALSGAPRFQLPFPCGQVWAGQTRTNHSPLRSIDFNRRNDIGDPVVAAAAGRVTRVGNEGNRSYGRWIEIDHGNGYRTRYAHLSRQDVRSGQRVRQGQRIGLVGSTGGSSGPHLHYELRRWGTAIRPEFDGRAAYFYGTRNYTSRNACGGGGSGSASGRVNTSGAPLNVRSGPSTSYRVVGTRADGARVTIRCQMRGQTVSGTYGRSNLWDRLSSGGYVADAYIYTGSDGQVAPTCR